MKNNQRILIVDDHEMIVEAYKNVLNLKLNQEKFNLKVDTAKDCDSAIKQMNQNIYDLVLLDICLPPSQKYNKINSGESLGVWIKQQSPDIKVIVITGSSDNYRINSILFSINPEGFMLKSEMGTKCLIPAVEDVLSNKSYYTESIYKLIRHRVGSSFHLDTHDFLILKEMSRATKIGNISNYVPLSKAGIEKRIRRLKKLFNVIDNTNRALLVAAREKGYI